MENTLGETGVDLGMRARLSESAGQRLGAAIGIIEEPTGGASQSRWRDPDASRKLIRQLLAIVNSRHEYVELEHDLAELDRLFPLPSSSMKGGAADSAVARKWQP